MNPGFHVVLAGPGPPDRGAGGDYVTEVRFLAVPPATIKLTGIALEGSETRVSSRSGQGWGAADGDWWCMW